MQTIDILSKAATIGLHAINGGTPVLDQLHHDTEYQELLIC